MYFIGNQNTGYFVNLYLIIFLAQQFLLGGHRSQRFSFTNLLAPHGIIQSSFFKQLMMVAGFGYLAFF
jgi:hypothetical protein